jgi:hypothetical protein
MRHGCEKIYRAVFWLEQVMLDLNSTQKKEISEMIRRVEQLHRYSVDTVPVVVDVL